jgi:hypothetical protein
MTFTSRVQSVVIRTSPYWPFRWLYGAAYAAILLWLIIRLRKIPTVSYLELRAPRKDHHFGSSDLDVRAVTKPLSGPEFFALAERLSNVLRPSRRWMRILDFYVFGPGEAELQRRLGPISFGNSRWIRLFGRNSFEPPAPIPQQRWANADICRAMYEYGYILQVLFQDSFDLHSTRNLYRRVARIDGHPQSAVRSGALRPLRTSDLEALFASTLAKVNAVFASSRFYGDANHSSIFHLVDRSEAPEHLREAIASCSAAIVELCEQLSAYVRGAILGCVPGTRFDYRIYLILCDDLTSAELIEVFRSIHQMYTAPDTYSRIPNTYLRLRHPIVMTSSMWRAGSCWYNALRPVEECFFLSRHGAALWGENLGKELMSPSDADIIRSAAIAVSDLRNGIWAAVYDRRPRQLVDALLGRLPVLWLLLSHSLVATTSGEALRECASVGLPQVTTLNDLRSRLSGLKPQELPATTDKIWQPAIEGALQLTDDLPRRAIALLDSQIEGAANGSRRAGVEVYPQSGSMDSADKRI